MKIETYRNPFYPLHQDHSPLKKIYSLITIIVLTILTAGIYLLFFRAAHLTKQHQAAPVQLKNTINTPTRAGFIGIEGLKARQEEHLAKLNQFAEKKLWTHLQTHTNHPDSGFDWWMFPIDRKSATHGTLYQITALEVAELKKDPVFMKNYREGVILIAQSWGWNLIDRSDQTSDLQKWTNYQVRLGKMLDSLKLFGQNDLREALIYFIDLKNIRASLEPWVQNLL